MSKLLRTLAVGSVLAGLVLTGGCAKVPETDPTVVKEVPLPTEIDEIDSSKLVPTAETQNCRKAPSVATAVKQSTGTLVGGGEYGTFDWAAGKTNGGQIWKTRLAYSKSNLAQVRIVPTFTHVGNVGDQKKLAAKVDSEAYINGDFFHLRASNLLYSAMVEEHELVYAPKEKTLIVGVVEEKANEHTGMQGRSYIKTAKGKLITQGLNLVYLQENAIGAYNSLKTTIGLPKISYLVEMKNNSVTKSEAAETFNIPTDPSTYVFVATGTAVASLSNLKVGDQVSYSKPTSAKTTRFLRTGLKANGTVTLPGGKEVPIVSVNHRGETTRAGVVLFTPKLYPTTSKLAGTLVTDTDGVVLKVYPNGKALKVERGQYVLEFGAEVAPLIKKIKVGAKVKIDNSYEVKNSHNLFAAFGNRENTMINGVIVANCNPGHEDIRPRTAIGWNENGDIWFVTTTMGVRNSADVFNRFRLGGSTVHQLAAWLKELGATQAVAVDGGGSTTMYVKQPDANYKRVDLPATEWVRTVPQGITMVTR